MKKILLIVTFISLIPAQEALTDNNPAQDQFEAENDMTLDTTSLQDDGITQKTDSTVAPFSIPAGLEFGYKGIEWGSSKDSLLKPFLVQDSLGGSPFIYRGKLGTDSVKVLFFYADSGFWKAEINFMLNQQDTDQEIKFFLRLEKSISEVYGPALKTTQIQGGPGPAYTNSIFPKFSRSFYRSTWYTAPVMIELLLNSMVLLPASDLPVFEGDFSILKLVYYNPDYQISSSPNPETKPQQSIFDIY